MDIESFVDKLETKAAQAIRADERDYIGEDGLLYCWKCRTRKQTRVKIFDRERTPYCLCKCEKERRDAEEAALKHDEFMKRVEEMRKIGFPESDMQNWTFAKDDGSNNKITTAMKNYVENFEKFKQQSKGLLLFGTVGTGKSFAAACVANALIDKGYPVLMTNFARIANTVQGMYDGKQAYYDSFNKFPLLILDDLAAERKSEYMNEIVYSVIDARYRSGLPLIVTTNLTADELKTPSDIASTRTYSRLMEMCLPIKVEGKDRRKAKLKEDFEPMSELLGLT